MDWGRAKSVLIFSFLMLNILLGYQLWTDIREQLNANVNSAELPPDKLLVMQQKRISLAANLPRETPVLGDLTYLLDTDTRQASKPIPLAEPVDSALIFTKSELVKALNGQIDDIDQYAYDLSSSRDGVFVMYKITDGYPMFNVKLELYNRNLKINGYLQDRVELVSRGEPKQVLTAAKAVASLIDTYLEDDVVISDIRLGYHGQIFDSDKQVSAPSWRVMLEDGKIYYVNAISGEVATDSNHGEAPSDEDEVSEKTTNGEAAFEEGHTGSEELLRTK